MAASESPNPKGGRPPTPNPSTTIVVRLQPTLLAAVDLRVENENKAPGKPVSRNVVITRALAKEFAPEVKQLLTQPVSKAPSETLPA